MSSIYVRTQIKTFLQSNSSENFIDLTGQFEELSDLLAETGLTLNDTWVGIQFIGNDELPITIGANNTQGRYRETGAIYIHVVDIAKLGVSDSILTRGEALRDLLRGRRLGSIFVNSVTPLNFEQGATLKFEDGYMSASFMIDYENDVEL